MRRSAFAFSGLLLAAVLLPAGAVATHKPGHNPGPAYPGPGQTPSLSIAAKPAERQLADGWGELYVFDGQHTRLFERYAALERHARRKRQGIWGRCGGDFHRPLTTRGKRTQ